MNKQKHILLATMLTVVVALVLGGCSTKVANLSQEKIKLGYVGPLTGDLASIGNDEKRAIQLALTASGRTDIEVIFEDSHCNGQAGSNAAQKLVNVDQVQLIMGAGCSDATLAMLPIIQQGQVVLFSSLSTSPELTKVGGEYFFRNGPSDDKSTEVLAKLIKNKKIALVSENNDFGQAFLNDLKVKLAEFDTTPVADEIFNTGTTDYKTILQKVKESKAEVLAVISNSPVSNGLVIKQAKELGLEMAYYGTDSIAGSEFSDTAQDAAEGVYAILVAANTADDRVNKLLQLYENTYLEGPASDAYTVLSYDRMNIVLKAIDAVGYDAEAIRNYLHTINYDGLAGYTSFDENGDSSILPLVLRFEDGELVPVQQ